VAPRFLAATTVHKLRPRGGAYTPIDISYASLPSIRLVPLRIQMRRPHARAKEPGEANHPAALQEPHFGLIANVGN